MILFRPRYAEHNEILVLRRELIQDNSRVKYQAVLGLCAYVPTYMLHSILHLYKAQANACIGLRTRHSYAKVCMCVLGTGEQRTNLAGVSRKQTVLLVIIGPAFCARYTESATSVSVDLSHNIVQV